MGETTAHLPIPNQLYEAFNQVVQISHNNGSNKDHSLPYKLGGDLGQHFQEHSQCVLLTESLRPILRQRHLDGKYYIGQDCKIYWRLTVPPEKGAESPTWFYVPNVLPTVNGQARHSYVLWKECIAPFIVLEVLSDNQPKAQDNTPWAGKFWIYEQVIRPAFYGIYQTKNAYLLLYAFTAGKYHLMRANSQKRYPIPSLGIELGIWQGRYNNTALPWARYVTLPWLRWWDQQGNLLLTDEERAEQAEHKLREERQRTEQEFSRAERLAAQLRSYGIEPDS